MGITDRQIIVSRKHIPGKRCPRKSFPTTPKSLGDLIQIKRVEKKLSPTELAQNTGVTKQTVRRWEKDAEIPNEREWRLLESLLGLETSMKMENPNS